MFRIRPPGAGQVRHDIPGEAQYRDEVDVDDAGEIIVAGIGQSPRQSDAGVIDENVDAPEGVERGRRHMPAGVRVRQVESQGDASEFRRDVRNLGGLID